MEIVYVARKINIGKLSALQRVKSEMFMYIDSGKNLFPTILTFPLIPPGFIYFFCAFIVVLILSVTLRWNNSAQT